MQLWKRFTDLTVTKVLRLPDGAKMEVNGSELSLAEIARIDGITPGTGAASKAAILDSSGNFSMPDNGVLGLSRAALAAAGSTSADAAVIADQVAAVTGADGTKGVALPAAATTEGPIFVINTDAANVLKVYPVDGGNDNINGLAEDAAISIGPGRTTFFIPTSATQWYCEDIAAASATKTELDYISGATPGTQVASKAVVADVNVNTGISKVTALHIGATGAEVQLTATPAEVNAVADVSGRLINLNATSLSITAATHGERIVTLSHTVAASTVTLPAATGTGNIYRFIVAEVNINNHVIKVANATDVLEGAAIMCNDTDATVSGFETAADSDTITLNGTTTGGAAIGDSVILTDYASGKWHVESRLTGTGTEATPFSATVV